MLLEACSVDSDCPGNEECWSSQCRCAHDYAFTNAPACDMLTRQSGWAIATFSCLSVAAVLSLSASARALERGLRRRKRGYMLTTVVTAATAAALGCAVAVMGLAFTASAGRLRIGIRSYRLAQQLLISLAICLTLVASASLGLSWVDHVRKVRQISEGCDSLRLTTWALVACTLGYLVLSIVMISLASVLSEALLLAWSLLSAVVGFTEMAMLIAGSGEMAKVLLSAAAEAHSAVKVLVRTQAEALQSQEAAGRAHRLRSKAANVLRCARRMALATCFFSIMCTAYVIAFNFMGPVPLISITLLCGTGGVLSIPILIALYEGEVARIERTKAFLTLRSSYLQVLNNTSISTVASDPTTGREATDPYIIGRRSTDPSVLNPLGRRSTDMSLQTMGRRSSDASYSPAGGMSLVAEDFTPATTNASPESEQQREPIRVTAEV